MAKKAKYYVVWEGNTPGIYSSWEHCQREIKGYANAKFRAFESLEVAKKAFKHPLSVKAATKTKKAYYYVVWHGFKPGIYADWNDVLKQISGFDRPIYKTFGSKTLAEKAFQEHPDLYKEGDFKKTKDLSEAELAKIGQPLELSLTVDAACNGAGDFEYQGVWNFNKETVFRVGPYKKGSNNIGEFLALVHALAFLNGHKDPKMKVLPIYSDSRIAMKWIQLKTCRTNQTLTPELKNLIARAENWLKNNKFENKILKWETKVWGEIPADFGRK